MQGLFAVLYEIKGTRPSLQRGLELCDLQYEEVPGRGIDDARNAARMLPWLAATNLDHSAAPSPHI